MQTKTKGTIIAHTISIIFFGALILSDMYILNTFNTNTIPISLFLSYFVVMLPLLMGMGIKAPLFDRTEELRKTSISTLSKGEYRKTAFTIIQKASLKSMGIILILILIVSYNHDLKNLSKTILYLVAMELLIVLMYNIGWWIMNAISSKEQKLPFA